jgi:hypothetical protein
MEITRKKVDTSLKQLLTYNDWCVSILQYAARLG